MPTYAKTSVTGGDGNVFNDNTGLSWAALKALTTGTAQASGDPVGVYASVIVSRSLSRTFLPFDTSSIPAGSTIVSATIQFNVTQIVSSNSTLHIVQSTQADPTSLVNNDFDNIPNSSGSLTSGGSVAVSATGSQTITLNATGLGWIVPGGYTKFALVEDHDVTNTDPSPNDYRFNVNTSENGTAGNRPTLTVIYAGGDEGAYFI